MKKIIKIMLLVLVSIISLFLLVFITPNIPQAKLEVTYLMPNSHQVQVEVEDLAGELLPISVHYQDFGSQFSETIVLLHGAFSSSHTFIPWAESLVLDGYRVILIDLPYFGLTGGFEDEVTSYRRSASMVNELLNSLELTKVHIGGNSLGGAVSWFFTSEYPQKVESLLLIDALPPYLESRPGQSMSGIFQSKLVSNIISQLTPKFIVRSILTSTYGDSTRLTEDHVTRYFELLRRDQSRAWLLRVSEESEPLLTYEERLASITVPTFILWGELDTWIPISSIDYFKEVMSLEDTSIMILPNLGHVPMEEDPSTVSYYQTFLNQLP